MARKNTKSVSLHSDTHELVKKMAEEYGISMQDIFETAMYKLHKKLFFEGLCNDFDVLKREYPAWKKETDRREELGINLKDEEQ